MATLPASNLRHPFPTVASTPPAGRRSTIPPPRASDPDSEPAPNDASTPSDGDFEDRLAQVRLRYRSGAGKKAEQRKTRKTGTVAMKGGGGSGGVFLPPVPLAEPISGGLAVDFGLTPYSERLNGRLAMLGLAALVLVNLASGKSLINYHSPAIVLLQVYFVAAVGAVYVKYEREKASIWPPAKN